MSEIEPWMRGTSAEDRINELEAQLTTAQAQIDVARNEGLEEAAKWHDAEEACCDLLASTSRTQAGADMHTTRSQTHAKSAAAIRALKSTPAPDQSARELTDFMEWLAHNNWLSIVLTEDFTAQSIVNVYRVQRLDAFNAQDKP